MRAVNTLEGAVSEITATPSETVAPVNFAAADTLDRTTARLGLSWTRAAGHTYEVRHEVAGETEGSWTAVQDSGDGEANDDTYTLELGTRASAGGKSRVVALRSARAGATSAEVKQTVRVHAPAQQPVVDTVTVGETTIALAWTDATDDADRTGYRLAMTGPQAADNVALDPVPMSAPGEANAAGYTVTGLEAGTLYTAIALTGKGFLQDSPASEPWRARTLPAAPAGLAGEPGPRNGEVRLTWEDPADGSIAGYEYRVKEESASAWGSWTAIPHSAFGEANARGYTVAGLTNGTEYAFRVRAKNSGPDLSDRAENAKTSVTVEQLSAASELAGQGALTTPARPAPANFRAAPGDGTVRLAWDPPGDPGIAGYQVRRKEKAAAWGAWTNIAGSDAETTGHTVEGLTNGTEYLFQVRAGTDAGARASAEAAATPSEVQHVTEAWVADDRLTLVWQRALDRRSAPAPGDFGVAHRLLDPRVTKVTIRGDRVVLTLEHPVSKGRDVTVSYTPGETPLKYRDVGDGVKPGPLVNHQVRNDTDTKRLFARFDAPTDTHGGFATDFDLVLRFNWDIARGYEGDHLREVLQVAFGSAGTVERRADDVFDVEVAAGSNTNPVGDINMVVTVPAELPCGTGPCTGDGVELSRAARVTVEAQEGLADMPVVLARHPEAAVVEGAPLDVEVCRFAGPGNAEALEVKLAAAETGAMLDGTKNAEGAVEGTLILGPGHDCATYGVATVDDDKDESHSEVTVRVLPADDGSYRPHSQAVATGWVRDDDEAPGLLAVHGLRATPGDESVTLHWRASAHERLVAWYEVSTDAGAWGAAGRRTGPESASGYEHTVTGLANGTEYAFQVRAVRLSGQDRLYGPASSVAATPVAPPAPGSAEVWMTGMYAWRWEGVDVPFGFRRSDSSGALTVTVSVSESGNMLKAGQAGQRRVSFAAGESEAEDLVVTTADDALDEDDSVVRVELLPGTGYAVRLPDLSETTVRDNDALPVLSVADTEATEGTDATLDFVVTLTPASGRTVTVEFATSDGTAIKGTHYTATSGMLTFPAGNTSQTASVPVNDNSMDDGGTMTLTLSVPVNATIGDGEATGTIVNDDPIPQAWIARFGRTVTGQVLDAVEARLAAPREAGGRATLAGQALPAWRGGDGDGTGDGDAANEDAANGNASGGAFGGGTDDRAAMAALGRWIARAGDGSGTGLDAAGAGVRRPFDGPGFESREVTDRELLTGSSFALSGGAAGGGFATLWGRGAITGFEGREGGLTLDGEVATGLVGADWAPDPGSGSGAGRWTVGLAVGHSRGTGAWRGSECTAGHCDGEIEASLTGLYPYAGLDLTERTSVWAAAGYYGAGELELEPEGGAAMKTDLSMAMGAAGVRSEVLKPEGGEGLSLAVKGDARFARTSSAAADDPEAGRLNAAQADVWLVRTGIEGSRRFALGGEASLTPSFELALRLDGGDAETGFGADLGGGLALGVPERGLSLDLEARGLVAHEEQGFREWGAGASLTWDPRPSTERGLSLTLRQSWGASPGGGMDALLGRETLAGLAANDNGDTTASTGRLEAELGYGIAMFDGGFTGTPHLGVGLTETGRDYRLGWRLTSARRGDPGFEINLDATRSEAADADAEHGIALRGTIRW